MAGPNGATAGSNATAPPPSAPSPRPSNATSRRGAAAQSCLEFAGEKTMDETDKVPFPNLAAEDPAAVDRVVVKPEMPETTARGAFDLEAVFDGAVQGAAGPRPAHMGVGQVAQ